MAAALSTSRTRHLDSIDMALLRLNLMDIILILIGLFLTTVEARKWNDTGKGTIVFEEAWTIPELLFQQNGVAPPLDMTQAEFEALFLDIHNQRLAAMDANGVDFMVLSCAFPCAQGFSDPATAAALAVKVNDILAASIANNTQRFGAFAALSMHDPLAAAQELNRTIVEHGFLGALINDYQQSGSDNTSLIYYDSPEFDTFWSMVQELDVPVYMHPRAPITQIVTLEYAHAPWIIGPSQEFAVTLSNHILGIITNGVFDRFPGVKLVVGHLGERIPSDLFRINEQLARQRPLGMPMLKNVSDYWRTNVFETTSGNFATELFEFHKRTVGLDRILFSIDYPYLSIEEGTAWLESLPLSIEQRRQLGRGRAIALLKLND